ncbi:DNA polymerase IV [Spongiibacter sp. KMU-158]|uniref:DNA polymerase IV n=1 Tax=Spongiibacter pelagi TaxID=2760804 RepID=A0A927C3I1_9GAMM|nr:DNA polymerase IV [Spongiibacter pelagi]MBD2858956.1 DNA polymerase IV [Spongiibacter pelagi]
MRKIIHCDCDSFFASVEMRDDPSLRGRAVAVGGSSQRRGVIATCNYEARRFGVRSAMPTGHAMRLCPDLIVIPPQMDKYRRVASDIRQIFSTYTDLIEPLSLDEAYLDVSQSKRCAGSASLMAEEIRQRVSRELGITISAGVAPNKFLAKVASDWNKPNGLMVIPPAKVDAFVRQLPVEKIHGVGKVSRARLHGRGIYLCSDLQQFSLHELSKEFGQFGPRLYEYARGIDERDVVPSRDRKSLSVERTFEMDIADAGEARLALGELLSQLQQRLQTKSQSDRVSGVFIKLKSCDFRQTTVEQGHIGGLQEQSFQRLLAQAWSRLASPVRLIGAGVRFAEPAAAQSRQLVLFH